VDGYFMDLTKNRIALQGVDYRFRCSKRSILTSIAKEALAYSRYIFSNGVDRSENARPEEFYSHC
jgi:hypothetical protein